MKELLDNYWSVFLRRLPLFLGVTVLMSALSVIFALSLSPVYVSNVRLLVEPPGIPTELAASTVRTPDEEQLQLIEQRLMTRANLLQVAEKFQVFEDQSEMQPDQIVSGMRERTTIRSSAGRDQAAFMTLSFEADTAEKAAEVLHEYIRLIRQEDEQSRTVRTNQTLEFFEDEVAQLSRQLDEHSERIRTFLSENSEALPETLDYRLNQQAQLQEQLAEVDGEIADLDDQRDSLMQTFESTGRVLGMAPATQTPEQSQLEELRSELNQALAVYSADNPRVRMLEAQIARLEETIASRPRAQDTQAANTGNSLLDVQLAEIAARRSALEKQRAVMVEQLETLNDTITRTPANAIQLDELQLRYDSIERQYNTAVDRLSQASTGERIETLARGRQITEIEPPSVPDNPSKPNRKLIAGGGGIFGVLLALGLVAFVELQDTTIRRPETLEARLGITPLATIPYIDMPNPARRWRQFGVLLVVLIGVAAGLYALHTYYQPLDVIVQQVLETLGLDQ